MRKSKGSRLAGYPEVYMEIAQNAYEGRSSEPLRVADERSSYPQLHRFNRFRNALVEELHPFALAAKDLIARRECVAGEWFITFQPAGLYEKKVFAAVAENPVLKAQRKEQERRFQEMPDPGEQLIIDMLKRGSVARKEEKEERVEEVSTPPRITTAPQGIRPADCVHEWGEYNCLLCGLPIPEST